MEAFFVTASWVFDANSDGYQTSRLGNYRNESDTGVSIILLYTKATSKLHLVTKTVDDDWILRE